MFINSVNILKYILKIFKHSNKNLYIIFFVWQEFKRNSPLDDKFKVLEETKKKKMIIKEYVGVKCAIITF